MPRNRIRPFVIFPMKTSTILELGLIGLIVRAFTGKRSATPSATQSPLRSKGVGQFILVFIFIVGAFYVILLVPEAMITQSGNVAATQSAGVPPRVSPPSQLGTDSTTFSKTSVIFDGGKLDGIWKVNAAPNDEVAILDSNGGCDVPVNKLPKGFLDLWAVTQAKLDAANK